MSKVVIKSPNADEVFEAFKRKQGNKLEKHYAVKGAVFQLDNVTSAEFVKGVTKDAIIFFRTKREVKPQGKTKKIEVVPKKLEKIRFYLFKGSVNKDEYKGPDPYPNFESIKPKNCPKCSGKGGTPCKKCDGKGTVACDKCKGTGGATCKACEGKGEITLEIEVVNEKGDKNKKTMKVQCGECFGNKKMFCPECGGSGKQTCKACIGTTITHCGDCEGTGTIYEYNEEPVPYQHVMGINPVLVSSTKLKIEKEIGMELDKAIEKVNGIKIAKLNDLTQKIIEPNLGYWDSNIKKTVNEAEKIIKQAQKDKDTTVLFPIFIFPMITLNCITKKEKQYEVIAIGADSGFLSFGDLP